MNNVLLVPKHYRLLDKLLNSGQLSWRTNQRIRSYPVKFDNTTLFLPGYVTQHELIGNSTFHSYVFRTAELHIGRSGALLSEHDAVSHAVSLTAGSSKLAELLNCSFHHFRRGFIEGLDTPQKSEETLYPGLFSACTQYLHTNLSGYKQEIDFKAEASDDFYKLRISTLTDSTGELKTLFSFEPEYVSRILQTYDRFLKDYFGNICVWDIFYAKSLTAENT